MQTYRGASSLALEASAQIVHNNVGATAAKEDGILATQATASTRHDYRLAVIAELCR